MKIIVDPDKVGRNVDHSEKSRAQRAFYTSLNVRMEIDRNLNSNPEPTWRTPKSIHRTGGIPTGMGPSSGRRLPLSHKIDLTTGSGDGGFARRRVPVGDS